MNDLTSPTFIPELVTLEKAADYAFRFFPHSQIPGLQAKHVVEWNEQTQRVQALALKRMETALERMEEALNIAEELRAENSCLEAELARYWSLFG